MQQNATRTLAAPAQPAVSAVHVIRRKCACGQHSASGECEECKKKKSEEGGGGDPLLRRSALSKAPAGQIPGVVTSALQQQGRPMDTGLRSRLESSFRCDLSRVRVHSDDHAALAASAINARAFTLGQNIWFGRNEFAPHSSNGFHLLAHEVAHTVQQRDQTPAVQTSLMVGPVDDPAELAADRAADAVLHSAPVHHMGTGPGVIRRRWLDRSPGKDERIVWEDYKTRYRVTRTRELEIQSGTTPLPPTVTPGADSTNVWLRLEWCPGVRASAELGANVPEELKNLLTDLMQTIASGGKAEDVIKRANLQPYLNVQVTKSGDWEIGSGVHLTVAQQGGVTGGGGQVSFEKGPVRVDVSGDVQKSDVRPNQPDIRGNVNVTITPGKTTQKFDCPVKEKIKIVEKKKFKCVKEVYSPPHDVTKEEEKTVPDTRERYVYFKYAKDIPNHVFVGEPDLTNMNLGDLVKDFSDKYLVNSIVGYTSPEGPMQPKGKFEGNEALGKERAVAAKKLVADACGPRRDEFCFSGGADAITPVGGGELHTLVQKGKEVEGRRLAEHAVSEFEGQPTKEESEVVNNPNEAAQRTPELQKELEKKKSPEERAELVYPKLRRATITLSGTKTTKVSTTTHEEGGFKPVPGECPPGVTDFAFPPAEDIKF